MENNWYIAYVNSKDKLLFGRVSFIERVDYASNVGKFQPSSVSNQLEFLKNIQNSMTLYGKEKKIAKIKALPYIAKYFDEGMKLRLSSQKFVEKIRRWKYHLYFRVYSAYGDTSTYSKLDAKLNYIGA